MYQQYKDKAAFYVVYIEEAHSSDVWQLPVNERQNVVYANPKTAEERASVAVACVRNLKIEFPAVIDSFDNAAERAYTAWPDRMFVVDKWGRIAHKSGPGPFGFRPSEVEAALKKLF